MKTPPSPPKALCAGTDPITAQVRALLLAKEGYSVQTCDTPECVLRLSKRGTDLLVIESEFPQALELVRKVKADSPGTPILMLTLTDTEMVEAPVDAVLTKGDQPALLIIAAAELIRRSREAVAS